jgi:pimeloyl-ACP methyl ester carboxylesterase
MQMKKVLKRILVGIVIMILLLGMIGFVYQRMGVKQDLMSYKPPGKLVQVGNNKMHIYAGGAGDITVVLASGWGTVNPYADFYPLYEGLGKSTKFVVYDRFGNGFSDLTDQKRDIDQIAAEIHEGLVKSGQKPPYIMVGHSLGSLETIRFTQKYPKEVKGIVLIDGGSPEYYADQKPITAVSIIQRTLINSGLIRFLYHVNGFADSLNNERNKLLLLPDNLKDLDRVSTLLIANNRNVTDEMKQSQKNAKLIVADKVPLTIPLTVITAGSYGKAEKKWLDSQEKLKNWSTIGKQIIIEDAYHYIHQYHPELIVSEIVATAKNAAF